MVAKVLLNYCKTTERSDSYSRTDITNLTSSIRQIIKTTSYLNFDIRSLTEDDDYIHFLDAAKEHITILADSINLTCNSSSRSVCSCLSSVFHKTKNRIAEHSFIVTFIVLFTVLGIPLLSPRQQSCEGI
jgi:mitochondrial fission protein ELM1